jgi:hypothetical protein
MIMKLVVYSFLFVFCILSWVIFISGCAAVMDSIGDISNDPGSFKAEAQDIQNSLPEGLPPMTYLIVGYGISFLRRVYVNFMRDRSKNKE